MEKLNVGDKVKAKDNYLDLFVKDTIYEIYSRENNLGDDMYYLMVDGKLISEWGLKNFELFIFFEKVSA